MPLQAHFLFLTPPWHHKMISTDAKQLVSMQVNEWEIKPVDNEPFINHRAPWEEHLAS
jgi:hypothetical protein